MVLGSNVGFTYLHYAVCSLNASLSTDICHVIILHAVFYVLFVHKCLISHSWLGVKYAGLISVFTNVI